MNTSELAPGISFRIIGPDTQVLPGMKIISNSWPFQILNTIFPFGDQTIKTSFKTIYRIPKMSTLALGAIINQYVKGLPKDSCFVNVGVWNGFTFLAGMLRNPDKTCIGIDNFSEFGGPREQFMQRFDAMKGPRHSFYDMDYEKYFSEKHEGRIGLYFYDGEHSYRNQLRGLQVAEPYLSDNAILIIDDTNCEEPRKATLDFIKSSGSEYKIIFERRTTCNCHPTFWNGVMIIQQQSK